MPLVASSTDPLPELLPGQQCHRCRKVHEMKSAGHRPPIQGCGSSCSGSAARWDGPDGVSGHHLVCVVVSRQHPNVCRDLVMTPCSSCGCCCTSRLEQVSPHLVVVMQLLLMLRMVLLLVLVLVLLLLMMMMMAHFHVQSPFPGTSTSYFAHVSGMISIIIIATVIEVAGAGGSGGDVDGIFAVHILVVQRPQQTRVEVEAVELIRRREPDPRKETAPRRRRRARESWVPCKVG